MQFSCINTFESNSSVSHFYRPQVLDVQQKEEGAVGGRGAECSRVSNDDECHVEKVSESVFVQVQNTTT